MTGFTTVRIVILDAPHGYWVDVCRGFRSLHWDQWFEDIDSAQSYARGLSSRTNCPVEDRSITFPCEVAASLAEHGYYTTPDGGLTTFDEHGTTVWDEEALDPELGAYAEWTAA